MKIFDIIFMNSRFVSNLVYLHSKKSLNMKDVTIMTDTGKNPNKADILYVTQNKRNSINNELYMKPIYLKL